MTSEYEKFQQKMFDQIDELEQAARQSERRETARNVLRETVKNFAADAECAGINVCKEVDKINALPRLNKEARFMELIERVYSGTRN